jgi:hypothetical protein
VHTIAVVRRDPDVVTNGSAQVAKSGLDLGVSAIAVACLFEGPRGPLTLSRTRARSTADEATTVSSAEPLYTLPKRAGLDLGDDLGDAASERKFLSRSSHRNQV